MLLLDGVCVGVFSPLLSRGVEELVEILPLEISLVLVLLVLGILLLLVVLVLVGYELPLLNEHAVVEVLSKSTRSKHIICDFTLISPCELTPPFASLRKGLFLQPLPCGRSY